MKKIGLTFLITLISFIALLATPILLIIGVPFAIYQLLSLIEETDNVRIKKHHNHSDRDSGE